MISDRNQIRGCLLGNSVFQERGCSFSKPTPSTQQALAKSLDPGGNIAYITLQCPGKESSEVVAPALHHWTLRPRVEVIIPGSYREPGLEPRPSNVQSALFSAQFLPLWLLKSGSPWSPLTVKQGPSKLIPLRSQSIFSSHLCYMPSFVLQEN